MRCLTMAVSSDTTNQETKAMGNRAIVQLDDPCTDHAIYLQWNGGPESINAFLSCMDGVRRDAFSVRFAQLVGNYFGGTLSIYSCKKVTKRTLKTMCPGDNGIYFVKQNPDGSYKISARYYGGESLPFEIVGEQDQKRSDKTYKECLKHTPGLFKERS